MAGFVLHAIYEEANYFQCLLPANHYAALSVIASGSSLLV
jgi:hypothetical protein